MTFFNPLKPANNIAFLETPEQIVSRQLAPFGLQVSAPLLKGHWYDGKPLALTQLSAPNMLIIDPATTFSNIITSISQALGTIEEKDVYVLEAPELIVLKKLPNHIYEKIRNKLAVIADAHVVSEFLRILTEEDIETQQCLCNTLIHIASLEAGKEFDKCVATHKNIADSIEKLRKPIGNVLYEQEFRDTLYSLIKDIFIAPVLLSESPFPIERVLAASSKDYLEDIVDDEKEQSPVKLATEFYKRHTPIVRITRTFILCSYGTPGLPTLSNYLRLTDTPIDYIVCTHESSFSHMRYVGKETYLTSFVHKFNIEDY